MAERKGDWISNPIVAFDIHCMIIHKYEKTQKPGSLLGLRRFKWLRTSNTMGL